MKSNEYNSDSIDLTILDSPFPLIKEFSEENEKLEKLLVTCLKNGISTIYCCAGHNDKHSEPFIIMGYNKKLNYLLNSVLHNKNIKMKFDNIIDIDDNNIRFDSEELRVSLSCDLEYADSMFETLTDLISRDKKVDLDGQLSSSFKILNRLRRYSMSIWVRCDDSFTYGYARRNNQKIENLENSANDIRTVHRESSIVQFIVPRGENDNLLQLISEGIESEKPMLSTEILKSENIDKQYSGDGNKKIGRDSIRRLAEGRIITGIRQIYSNIKSILTKENKEPKGKENERDE